MDMERFKNSDLKQNYNFDYEIENKLLRDDYDTNANLFNKIPDKFNLKLICQDEPSGIVVGSSDLILKKVKQNKTYNVIDKFQ